MSKKITLCLMALFFVACSPTGTHSPLPDDGVEVGAGGNDDGGGTDDSGSDGMNDTVDVEAPGVVSFSNDILPIVEQRCALCHNESSSIPNWKDYKVAFNKRDRIYERVVEFKNMPLNNLTNMTQEERDIFADWIDDGARP